MEYCKSLVHRILGLIVYCLLSFSPIVAAAGFEVELKNENDKIAYSIHYHSSSDSLSGMGGTRERLN